MVRRAAVAFSLLAFAICLVEGLLADNSFATTVGRALVAMAVTLVIGLVLAGMMRKMIQENLKLQEEKSKKSSTQAAANDR